MLRMKRDELAKAAQVAVATLADFEAGKRAPHPRTLAAIRSALEAAGVEFVPENGGGAGVRLKTAEVKE
ncbi:helix-turn-helix domain-containing protein [Tanticharoenia sakaeratensis]|nr:helix-turn-helix transcriptional regulator [Tanticharoenia sakaeratensis]